MNSGLKDLLRNSKGQAELGVIVVSVVVVAVIGIIGVTIFQAVNRAQPTNTPLMDLVPLTISAVVVIGGIASLLYLFHGGM